jgi:hypothetical protein
MLALDWQCTNPWVSGTKVTARPFESELIERSRVGTKTMAEVTEAQVDEVFAFYVRQRQAGREQYEQTERHRRAEKKKALQEGRLMYTSGLPCRQCIRHILAEVEIDKSLCEC